MFNQAATKQWIINGVSFRKKKMCYLDIKSS